MSIQKGSARRSSPNKQGFYLFLLTTPFLIATFVFSYLPLHGWIYAFFDYRAGFKLLDTAFVGLKHFQSIAANSVVRADVGRVMLNTFAISLLNIVSSVLPAIFAIALSEIRGSRFRRVVQTVTTIPNFISWVLVYSLAYAMLSSNGFINNLLLNAGSIETPVNYLVASDHVWLNMWGYYQWKNLGWNAILYVAAIGGIDQELYEAADIDGAGRLKKILHITVPLLMPTFFVLLLLSIANFLNNGVDQFYVFKNALNKEFIEVLDLYVYNKGFVSRNIPYSTAVGMLKSIVSITLLFGANWLSKLVRKESIF